MARIAPYAGRLSIAAVALGCAALVIGLIASGRFDKSATPPPAPSKNSHHRVRTPSPPTLFGTTLQPLPGVSSAQRLKLLESQVGKPQVLRIFSRHMPPSWPAIRQRVRHIPVVVSFKGKPAAILRGRFDAYLSHWFRSAPRAVPTYWVYFHEPEDNIERHEFTARQFRLAWQHVAAIANAAGNPQLHSTVVLMCWTANPVSGRNWHDYVTPGTADVLAWDCYNHGAVNGIYLSPETIFERSVAVSKQAGATWAVAEIGSVLAPGHDPGARRAAWLHQIGSYASANHAAFLLYFDSDVGGDFVLADRQSRDAMRDLMTTSPS